MGRVSKGKCVTNCKSGIHIDEILSRAIEQRVNKSLLLSDLKESSGIEENAKGYFYVCNYTYNGIIGL